MKKITLAGIFSIFALCAFGQKIKFENSVKDFGEVEYAGKVETVFSFKNTGSEPIKLTTVKPSCGCTTPEWPKGEIAPGATGEIKVTYDSKRVGPFNKSITVIYDNKSEEAQTLFIKGKIAPKPVEDTPQGNSGTETPIPFAPQSSIDYKFPNGALSFDKLFENIGTLTAEDKKTIVIHVKNTSTQEVELFPNLTYPAGVSPSFKDKKLAPSQESEISIIVDGAAMKKAAKGPGYFNERLMFKTSEQGNSVKTITINGTFDPMFTEEEKANSPKIVFEETDVKLGKVIEGEKVVHNFKFTNGGKSDLVLSDVRASCGCTASKPSKDRIAPGEEAEITATFDSRGRLGVQNKTITVKSNDLDAPTVVLKFSVEVEKDPFHSEGNMMGNHSH